MKVRFVPCYRLYSCLLLQSLAPQRIQQLLPPRGPIRRSFRTFFREIGATMPSCCAGKRGF